MMSYPHSLPQFLPLVNTDVHNFTIYSSVSCVELCIISGVTGETRLLYTCFRYAQQYQFWQPNFIENSFARMMVNKLIVLPDHCFSRKLSLSAFPISAESTTRLSSLTAITNSHVIARAITSGAQSEC